MNIKTENNFKYNYEKLDPASEEFKILKGVYFTTKTSTACNVTYKMTKEIQIYKVFRADQIKTVNKKSNNLMLFHGTSKEGVTGILKEGFRNSEKGWFGKGVYMTDSSETAFHYSRHSDWSARYYYVFVNEVLESEKLRTFTKPKYNNNVDTLPRHQFEKHFFKSSPQPTEEEDYVVDSEGRRYVNTPMRGIFDEYVARARVTIPRYLIVPEVKQEYLANKSIYKEKKSYGYKVSFLLFCVPTVAFSLFHLFKIIKK